MISYSYACKAGDVSEKLGDIPSLLAQGYQFLGSGDVGQERREQWNLYDALIQTNHLYLGHNGVIAFCWYRVTYANNFPAEKDSYKPGSSCMKIR
jgi:hypothetical protein